MKTIDRYTLLSDACKRIKLNSIRGIWDGRSESDYFMSCKWMLEYYPCVLIFTRDTGYHSSGWWKNPDYERCYHLSISFPGGIDKGARDKIITYLFGSNSNLIWTEPPYSDKGKSLGVWHYRLFCDENWRPLKPRGEVYSTQFTERGWKSYSEKNALKQNSRSPMNTEQLKTAEEKRSELIQEHLQRFGENNLFRASLDNFRETGTPSGSFRAALHALMQDFASQESNKAVSEFKEKLKNSMDVHLVNRYHIIDLIDKL